MRVMIAGGGTGGHLYPAVAIAEELQRKVAGVRIAYLGTKHGLEARVLPSLPWIRFFPIRGCGLSRRSRLANIRALPTLCAGLLQAAAALIRFRPHVVIGVGGYSSFFPVLLGALAGRVFPIRTLIHEQNVVPGLANRVLARFVDVVLLSFPQARNMLAAARRTIVTGNPVREDFARCRRSLETYRLFGLDPARRTVLVFGGSLGSEALARGILQAKDTVASDETLQVLLVVGEAADEAATKAELAAAGVHNVVVRRYIERMADAFSIADLVVARAGATTLAEISVCAKPSLLIPWQGAVDDHQSANARALAGAGACAVARDDDIAGSGLVRLIRELVYDDARLAEMAFNVSRFAVPDARARILGEIRWSMKGARA